MLILSNTTELDGSTNSNIHAIFGVGLIGSSLCRNLGRLQRFERTELPFSWEKETLQSAELSAIRDTVVNLTGRPGPPNPGRSEGRRVNIVWSAGKCGFGSGETDTKKEFTTFSRIVDFSHELLERAPELRIGWYLISSAGGVFEGGTGNELEPEPSPQRPYGILKLEQERLLLQLPPKVEKHIFRLSSVYGFIASNSRSGLVQTMLVNGIRRGVTTIMGDFSTLRDYVFCEDVTRYVSQQLVDPSNAPTSCHLLASGKPSSIAEIRRHVEDVIGRRVFLNCLRRPSNRLDICFSPRQLPTDWSSIDLITGIRAVYHRWRDEGSRVSSR